MLQNNELEIGVEKGKKSWKLKIILYLVLIILPLQVLSTFVFSFPSNVTKKTQPTREQLTRNENENKKNLCLSVEESQGAILVFWPDNISNNQLYCYGNNYPQYSLLEEEELEVLEETRHIIYIWQELYGFFC